MSERNPSLAGVADEDIVREVFARELQELVLDELDDCDLRVEIEERGLESNFDIDLEEPQQPIDAQRAMQAYRALTPATPEPIRELALELAGRIA